MGSHREQKLFDPHVEPERLEGHRYFGDFVLNGDALVGDLADAYGVSFPAGTETKTLADFLARTFHGRVVVGDRVRVGGAQTVVREIENGRITRVGLKVR